MIATYTNQFRPPDFNPQSIVVDWFNQTASAISLSACTTDLATSSIDSLPTRILHRKTTFSTCSCKSGENRIESASLCDASSSAMIQTAAIVSPSSMTAALHRYHATRLLSSSSDDVPIALLVAHVSPTVTPSEVAESVTITAR
jgi:hypothetical protein